MRSLAYALPLSSKWSAQADKDIAKAIAAMGELEVALAAKKEVSGRVKALKKEVEGARAEVWAPSQSCGAGHASSHYLISCVDMSLLLHGPAVQL